ncbi:IS5/IS1182 family transposase, partial [Falsihalocynthiibacter sp. S25ZX9]
MLGPKQETQSALFYDFSIEAHIPYDHVLRTIGGVIVLSSVRQYLSEFFRSTERPSVDPELMTRILLVGYHSACSVSQLLGEGVTLRCT